MNYPRTPIGQYCQREQGMIDNQLLTYDVLLWYLWDTVYGRTGAFQSPKIVSKSNARGGYSIKL